MGINVCHLATLNPGANEHWAPAYQYCDPCAFKYETIAHFEHLGSDGGNEDQFLAMTVAPKNQGPDSIKTKLAGVLDQKSTCDPILILRHV